MSVAGDIIQSVRDQIPDQVTNPGDDGTAFSFASLLRWLNDANRIICGGAPVIQDWYGLPSSTGMDIYELPSYVTSVEQLWYNLQPCTRTAELDDIFTTKITARSWWFGPHSVHAIPRVHVWPSCDTTGASSMLTGGITATSNTYTLSSTTGFQTFGFHRIDDELVLVRSIADNGVVTNILRGQGGTEAVGHSASAPVVDCNIFFKCFRLPKPLVTVDSVVELPQSLWPLVELYIMHKAKMAEQSIDEAQKLLKSFLGLVDKLAEKSPQIKGLRQGLQVRTEPPGPELYGGRIFIK